MITPAPHHTRTILVERDDSAHLRGDGVRMPALAVMTSDGIPEGEPHRAASRGECVVHRTMKPGICRIETPIQRSLPMAQWPGGGGEPDTVPTIHVDLPLRSGSGYESAQRGAQSISLNIWTGDEPEGSTRIHREGGGLVSVANCPPTGGSRTWRAKHRG